jgi:hypothetical protein
MVRALMAEAYDTEAKVFAAFLFGVLITWL